MTLIRYAAFCSLASLASLAGAQVSLSSPENVPVVGSSFTVHTAGYQAAPPAGADMHYDYSALTGTGSVTYDWISPDEYSNPSLFPTAQMALANGNGDTLFYRNASAGLEQVGERRNYLGTYVVEAPLTDGVLQLKLPLAYAATWTDNVAGGPFTIGSDPNANRSGTITGDADAYGMLHLPGGVEYAVLRVHTRLQETNSFNVGIPVTVTHKRTEYAYYAPFLKFPIFRSYGDSLTSSVGLTQNTSATEWLDAAALGIADHAADAFSLELFPNPASSAVDLTYLTLGTANMRVEVTDARGALVLRQDLGGRSASMQREHLDVSMLQAGLYQVILVDAQGAHSVKRLAVIR